MNKKKLFLLMCVCLLRIHNNYALQLSRTIVQRATTSTTSLITPLPLLQRQFFLGSKCRTIAKGQQAVARTVVRSRRLLNTKSDAALLAAILMSTTFSAYAVQQTMVRGSDFGVHRYNLHNELPWRV